MFVETPQKGDHVSGGRVQFHPTDPDVFEIITWLNYSAKNDCYHGVVSTWQIAKYKDQKTGTVKLGVFFLDLHVRMQHEKEWRRLEVGQNFVPDQHSRRAREEGRKREGSLRFQNLFVVVPKAEWVKWLVDPADQVISGSHTSAMAR